MAEIFCKVDLYLPPLLFKMSLIVVKTLEHLPLIQNNPEAQFASFEQAVPAAPPELDDEDPPPEELLS